jgi:hypothetical protein
MAIKARRRFHVSLALSRDASAPAWRRPAPAFDQLAKLAGRPVERTTRARVRARPSSHASRPARSSSNTTRCAGRHCNILSLPPAACAGHSFASLLPRHVGSVSSTVRPTCSRRRRRVGRRCLVVGQTLVGGRDHLGLWRPRTDAWRHTRHIHTISHDRGRSRGQAAWCRLGVRFSEKRTLFFVAINLFVGSEEGSLCCRIILSFIARLFVVASKWFPTASE